MAFAGLTAILSGFSPFEVLVQLASMGGLIDYITVVLIVMLFRVKFPDIQRSFKCPAIFIVAPIALMACLYLLSKQIISKDGGLLLTGQLLIWWFVAMFVLYLLRKWAIKRQSANL